MTKNSYSKAAIRARMDATGEPYSVAARALKRELELIDPFDGAKADFGELILFAERLAVILSSGITFFQAVRSIGSYTEDPVLSEGIEFLIDSASNGVGLAKAMRMRPNAFRGIFPELIETGVSYDSAMLSLAKLYRVELEMEQRRFAQNPL